MACDGTNKNLFPVDKAELQSIYEEVSEGYVGLREQVVRQPQGCLKYPYLIPAGFYQNLWDWDAFLWLTTLSRVASRSICATG